MSEASRDDERDSEHEDTFGRIEAAARRWSRYALQAFRNSFSPDSQLLASSIGYYTFFSLFPLALIVVAIGSNWLDPALIEARLVDQLEFVIPGLPSLLGSNLERLAGARAPVTGIAILALLWSASNVFNVVTRAMDRVWGVDINLTRSRWRHRGLAIMTVIIVTTLLLIATTAQGTFSAIANSLLPTELANFEAFTTDLWSVLLSIGIFTVLYHFLPHVRLPWRRVLPGAIAAGLLWEIAKRLFLYFIGTFLSPDNLVYGSVASIIAFLFWVYTSSIIFIFGAYLNRQAVSDLPDDLVASSPLPPLK